ncbi:hypothetical protein [Isosphaera pallida]|uniref:hypothetical protein n=1 Tax=Isosphaera pallida TaxID=128 RepID=UPI0002E43307|nr:hypothetical protein [Isosphaera pallida]
MLRDHPFWAGNGAANDRLPDLVAEAVRSHYILKSRLGVYRVFRPRTGPPLLGRP